MNILIKFEDHDYTKSKKHLPSLSCVFQAKKSLFAIEPSPISGHFCLFTPPENIEKPDFFEVFRAYRMRTLVLTLGQIRTSVCFGHISIFEKCCLISKLFAKNLSSKGTGGVL